MTYDVDVPVDEKLADTIETAVEYRDDARTFNTKVGAAVGTFDGDSYGGFNMENKRHRGIHAEEMAINHGMLDGYNGTDFRSLVIVYAEDGADETEIFPACLSCQAWAWDYTHPQLDVVVADTDGDLLYRTQLDELTDHPGPGTTYPSNRISGRDDLKNAEPQLSLDEELWEAYEDDEAFRTFCDMIDVDVPSFD